MFGAMTGDIVGSIYEFNTIKTKEFPLFSGDCSFTDDTVMTVAIARALLRCCGTQETFIRAAEEEMHSLGRKYPYAGYGSRFFAWLLDDCPHPYNSYGNGSAMRVSPCGLIAVTLDEALSLSAASAEVTHNHPEGIKGARAAAAAVFLAKTGSRKEQIAEYIRQNFYPLEETLDEIREYYLFNETCMNTVPQAITAFLESESYEDAVRNAVSLGGDSDTLAAITGGIAWAYYRCGKKELPQDMKAVRMQAEQYLPAEFVSTAERFEELCSRRAQCCGAYGECAEICVK